MAKSEIKTFKKKGAVKQTTAPFQPIQLPKTNYCNNHIFENSSSVAGDKVATPRS